jgi:hypothetical protein
VTLAALLDRRDSRRTRPSEWPVSTSH